MFSCYYFDDGGGSREGGMSYLVRSFLFLLYLFVFLLSGHDVD